MKLLVKVRLVRKGKQGAIKIKLLRYTCSKDYIPHYWLQLISDQYFPQDYMCKTDNARGKVPLSQVSNHTCEADAPSSLNSGSHVRILKGHQTALLRIEKRRFQTYPEKNMLLLREFDHGDLRVLMKTSFCLSPSVAIHS